MRFAVVLPTFIRGPYRAELAKVTFRELEATRYPSEAPYLVLLSEGEFEYPSNESPFFGQFFLKKYHGNCPASGTEQTLAYGTELAFVNTDVTHVVWMGDDARFNPNWLIELESLIERHPEARAWSVYRSAHEAYHKPIEALDYIARLDNPFDALTAGEVRCEKRTDVKVVSLCGHGMTFSREEWMLWGIDWKTRTRWESPRGNTLDLHHPWARPGERWCTARSYVDHTGRAGVNCTPDIPEYAIDFVE